jgi:MFS family permease
MQLVAPDILSEVRGLSLALCALGLTLGLLVWLVGWRAHRFWIVLTATVSAGILGLSAGPSYGTTPLLAGILLAVAAGALSLALVRVVAFLSGGLVLWAAVRAVVPGWDEPLVCFVIGGLGALVLFRLWMMVMTSLAGSLLLAYFGLCLADRLGKLDAVAFAQAQTLLLNGACGLLALSGVVVQGLLELRWNRPAPQPEAPPKPQPAHPPKEKERDRDKDREKEKPWWEWARRAYRRAG